MHDCDHADRQQYVRFTRENSTTHYAVYCHKCAKLVKSKAHNGKLLIKHSEIPSGRTVFDIGSVK